MTNFRRNLWTILCNPMHIVKGTIQATSIKFIFAYLCFVDNGWDMLSGIYYSIRGNKKWFSGVFLGDNIISTLSGRRFGDKTAGLVMFLSVNIKWLFVHTSRNT